MSVKAAPRFGGGGEKCKTCTKTVYPNERVSYDNGTWHQLCFKCLSCRSTLSLTAVAMISGDLYCKTCFKKIFMREGKYSSFEQNKSLPKDVAAELTHAASMPEHVDNTTKQPSPVISRAGSVIGTASTTAAATRSPSTSTTAPPQPQTPTTDLQAAIEKKDFAQCQALLAAHGAQLLFEPSKSGASVLEWALTSYMHKSMGGRLVGWLGEKVGEADKAMRQNGLVSVLGGTGGEGSQSGKNGRVEESKEGTETAADAEAGSTNEVEA